MPEWVIVGNGHDDLPVVLTEWVLSPMWSAIDVAKAGEREPCIFRDRWRAKRQALKLPRAMHARCIRRDRL
jgi:hypothetical protein